MLCQVCKTDFELPKALITHLELCHNITSGPFKCTYMNCKRIFSSTNSFKKHITTHLREKDKETEQVFNNLPGVSNYDFNLPQSKQACSESCFQNYTDLNQLSDTMVVFKTEINNFVSKLYINDNMPRSMIQIIIESTMELFQCGIFKKLKNIILNRLQKTNETNEFLKQLEDIFNYIEKPFEGLSTDYKRIKFFTSTNHFVLPQDINIGQTLITKKENNEIIIENVAVHQKFIPLRDIFKNIFSIPGVFEKTYNYLISLKSCDKLVSNFVQGDLWVDVNNKQSERMIFPIFLYFDDFEVNNPLGSHANLKKIGAVYASLPCIPPEIGSILSSIFLVSLFHTKDRSLFGNSSIFKCIINELQFLYDNGIGIVTNSGPKQIFFQLGLILGDNLGLNSILGFTESFSSNYYCRFCKSHKSVLKSQCKLEYENLRTKENYAYDSKNLNVSDTGIKEISIWNDVSNFHVITNQSIDIMHDIFEGVCHYDITLIFDFLINKYSLFSLELLNNKIKVFNFGYERNKPITPITHEAIKKRHLKMSASEMMVFCRYLGAIIGENVPRDNRVWQLYIKLCQIIEIVTARTIHLETYELLETLVFEHHDIYVNDLHDDLKPKHHHMLHYPHIMKMVGPLINLSSMRFESKHRESKFVASCSQTRKNILHTLSIRHQLKLCHLISTEQLMKPNNYFGKINYVNKDTIVNEFKGLEFPICKDMYQVSWIQLNGIYYRENMGLIISSDELPQFGNIQFIYVIDNIIYFLCILLETISFDEHVRAYLVTPKSNFTLLKVEDLFSIYPTTIIQKFNNYYIYLRTSI